MKFTVKLNIRVFLPTNLLVSVLIFISFSKNFSGNALEKFNIFFSTNYQGTLEKYKD